MAHQKNDINSVSVKCLGKKKSQEPSELQQKGQNLELCFQHLLFVEFLHLSALNNYRVVTLVTYIRSASFQKSGKKRTEANFIPFLCLANPCSCIYTLFTPWPIKWHKNSSSVCKGPQACLTLKDFALNSKGNI